MHQVFDRGMFCPHTPTHSPTVESSQQAVPNVGERGQKHAAAEFSDAHTWLTRGWHDGYRMRQLCFLRGSSETHEVHSAA